MRRPQMGWRSAGFSRTTPSIHMLTLTPSCYLSVSLCLSPVLTCSAHMAGNARLEPQRSSSSVLRSPAGKWTSVWAPYWHIRSSVCLIGLKPSALNPKQNEQAVRWLLASATRPHVINTSDGGLMEKEVDVEQKQAEQFCTFCVCHSH